MITYSNQKEFTPKELEALFLSVNWSSGHYPDKLATAMSKSGTVYSAWNDSKLIGLVNALDDGIMTAYVHYLLVDPAYQGQGIGKELIRLISDRYQDYLRIVLISYGDEVGFYEECGFKPGKDGVPMYVTSLWT